MNEMTLQLIAGLKLVWIAVFAYLYGRGGINSKWIRRYLGALFLTLGICLFSLWQGQFSWLYLISLPLLISSLSIGYGAQLFTVKLLKRSRYGLLISLSALPITIVQGTWLFFGLYTALCITMSVVLGVFNIANSAREEESLIGMTIGLNLFLI